jgi:flavin reductase (DIM6/NTAB) family NADH-FMN oxidoreductase RutF
MPRPALTELPEWEPGTVAILATAGGPPHAIPVSTAVAAGPRRVLLALSRRRESLERLRSDPRVALTILAAGDVAFTAHGRASVVADPMEVSDRVAAVLLEVDALQDHGQPRFAIDDGVRWHWTDPDAERADGEIRAALRELAR